MSFVLVEEKGKYLLIQEVSAKHKGKWYLPGGKAEKGENPVKAAERETKEEAGCRIKITGFFCLKYFHAFPAREKLHIYYCGKALSKRLKKKPDEDSLGAAWFTYNEICALPVRDNLLELIDRFRKPGTDSLPPENFIFPAS